MKQSQYKVVTFGLDDLEKSVIKSYLNIFKLGFISPWEFSDDESLYIAFVDIEQQEGKEFVFNCMAGSKNILLISVGSEITGYKAAGSLSRPLKITNLQTIFQGLNNQLEVSLFKKKLRGISMMLNLNKRKWWNVGK